MEKRYFLHSHMARNNVKVGDVVKQYETQIGTIGNANSFSSFNKMYSHDHFAVYKNLTVEQVYKYIYGWSLRDVEKYYIDPKTLGLNFEKIYPDIAKVDVGGRGYDFGQSIKNSNKEHIGFHPAVDVNNSIGGDSDYGKIIMASCDGVVIHEWRGWTSNGGWGNMIIIEEIIEDVCTHCCPKHC